MDEVDSIGSARTDNGGGGGDSEVQRTMLELLNQLDGFEATNKIKVGPGCTPANMGSSREARSVLQRQSVVSFGGDVLCVWPLSLAAHPPARIPAALSRPPADTALVSHSRRHHIAFHTANESSSMCRRSRS